MPRRLAELLVENLNDLHRRVIQALAAFAAPVDAAAIAAVINPPATEAAVTGTLQRFLSFELVQSSGEAWALTFDEADWFLPADSGEHAALLRNAAAQLKVRRHADPQSMDDLQGHFAYLGVLLAAGRYSVAYNAMIPMTEVLKRWNSNHLLLAQREKIREEIGVPELKMLNDNELGDAYAIVGDFKEASLVYGTALTAANQLGNASVRTAVRYNFATCYWQSGRADLAYNYYLDAFRDAEQHRHHVIWRAAALGLAECHRRWGEYDRAFGYIDRIPANSMSALLLLRIARWRVETGRTGQARDLITRAREASRGSDRQLAACHEAQADLLLADGDLAGARIEATLALEQAVLAHNAVVLLLARTTLCWVELFSGDLNSAREHIEEAEHYRPAGSALVVVALNALLHQQSDPGLARRLFNTLASEARERIVDEKDRGAHDMLGFAICGQTSRPDQAIKYFDTTTNGPSVLRKRRNLLVERLDTYARPAGALRPVLEILTGTQSRTAD